MTLPSRVLAVLFAGGLAAIGCTLRETVDGVPAPEPSMVATATVVLTVVDHQERPVTGARLVSFPINRLAGKDASGRNNVEMSLTDRNGVVELAGLPIASIADQPIRYTLLVYASGFERGELTPSPLTTGERRRLSAQLATRTPRNGNRIALFDGESGARATDLLVRSDVAFTPVTGLLAATNLDAFDVLVVGFDQSVNSPFMELLAETSRLTKFVSSGGLLAVLQQNDTSWDPRALPVPVELLTEHAPINDFETLVLRAPDHPLVRGLTPEDLRGWDYIEPLRRTRLAVTSFDGGRARGLDPRWAPILTAPSPDEAQMLAARRILVEPEAAVALAEARVGAGLILLDQTAFYQGSMGELTNPSAIKLRDNLLVLLASYKRP